MHLYLNNINRILSACTNVYKININIMYSIKIMYKTEQKVGMMSPKCTQTRVGYYIIN